MSRQISDKMVSFATRLLSERLVTLGLPDITAALAATDVANMSMTQGKTFIERLLAMPKDPDEGMPAVVANATRNGKGNRPGKCFACSTLVDQDEGFYFLDGGGKWAVHHKVGECREATADEPQVGIDLSHVPPGLYAVPGMETSLKVQISKPVRGNWKGWTFVQDGAVYGYGGRMGRAEPEGLYMGKAMDAILAIANDVVAAAAKYGHITGRCGQCKRPLEDDKHVGPDGLTSVQRGIGPVCMHKVGL